MPKKVDGTQREIVSALRDEGVFVVPLHEVGRGVPDLLLAHPKTSRWYLAECKDAKYFRYEAKKNPKTHARQKEFRAKAHAPVLLFMCASDAVTWARNVSETNQAAVQLFDRLDEVKK